MIPESYRYILLEGPDRSGKDTQAAMLVRHLTDKGQNPLLVAEPCADLPTGKLLRQLLKSGEFPESHAALFLADRMALQSHVLKHAIDAGRPVVSVRSFLSTLCYQAEDWPMDWLYCIHEMLPIKPTHVVILDVDSDEAQRRMGRDIRSPEMYEKIEIQRRVRQRYLELPQQDRFWRLLHPAGWAVVIPEASEEEVHNRVWNFVGVDHG